MFILNIYIYIFNFAVLRRAWTVVARVPGSVEGTTAAAGAPAASERPPRRGGRHPSVAGSHQDLRGADELRHRCWGSSPGVLVALHCSAMYV